MVPNEKSSIRLDNQLHLPVPLQHQPTSVTTFSSLIGKSLSSDSKEQKGDEDSPNSACPSLLNTIGHLALNLHYILLLPLSKHSLPWLKTGDEENSYHVNMSPLIHCDTHTCQSLPYIISVYSFSFLLLGLSFLSFIFLSISTWWHFSIVSVCWI